MHPFAIFPYFALHSLAHHLLMDAYVPIYRSFDTFTKHCWIGRATALATQLIVLPVSWLIGAEQFCMNTLGMYILHDMIHCAMYERDRMTWIHHIATFAGYLYSFWAPPDLFHSMTVATLLLESTSPFIQMCWFTNKSKNGGRWWFPILAGWTLFFYAVVRCFYFPYYVFWYMPPFMWVLGAIFTTLNWIWMYQLVGYARAVVKKSGTERLE